MDSKNQIQRRELRFRVWTGNGMEYDVTVGKFGTFYVNPEAKGDGLDPKDTASLTPNTTKYHEVHPVMQFTGLKDKNGEEIYEGDIIKHNGNAQKNKMLKVTFESGSFCLRLLDSELSGTSKAVSFIEAMLQAKRVKMTAKFEVIGNVYENPELIKP